MTRMNNTAQIIRTNGVASADDAEGKQPRSDTAEVYPAGPIETGSVMAAANRPPAAPSGTLVFAGQTTETHVGRIRPARLSW